MMQCIRANIRMASITYVGLHQTVSVLRSAIFKFLILENMGKAVGISILSQLQAEI